eukprot:1161301-Pelagomonas_calceolata.AAC.12
MIPPLSFDPWSACGTSQVDFQNLVGDEAASHFSALAPSLVHIAGDVGAAVTHIKSVLPA